MSDLFRTNAADPTRTTMIRRQYEKEMRRRFEELKRLLREVLSEGEVRTNAPRFDFVKDPKRVDGFMRWLRQQTDLKILDGTPVESARKNWQRVYIESAYQKGIASAAQQMERAGAEVKDTYISSAFFRPVHADRAGLIYSRSYSALDGVSRWMEGRIASTLSRGIIEGRGMKDIARDLAGVVDMGLTRAKVIVRTEVISAHAEASLNSYQEAGLEGVKAQAEFATARDNRVCPKCEDLEGKVVSIDKARGVIPVHPNCRCAWLPVVENATGVVLS